MEQGEAPLKETLAAALVMLDKLDTGPSICRSFLWIWNIPIEAALIGQNIAPGFNREFVSEGWDWISAKVWE